LCSKSTRGLSLHQAKTPVYRFSGFSFCLMRKGDQRRPSQGRPITFVLSFSRGNRFNSAHMQPATAKFERRESHSNTTHGIREFGWNSALASKQRQRRRHLFDLAAIVFFVCRLGASFLFSCCLIYSFLIFDQGSARMAFPRTSPLGGRRMDTPGRRVVLLGLFVLTRC
jgi:hypothetical protein